MNINIEELKNKTKIFFDSKKEIYCPYFQAKISLTSDGFNYLLYKPNRLPRNIKEQVLKLKLLKFALEIIPKCGTLQEYRNQTEKIDLPDKKGFYKTRQVQYWGFHAILPSNKFKIKVIIKKIGDGKVVFWSVMPYDQKLYSKGIDEN